MPNRPPTSTAANENFEIDQTRSVKLSIDRLVEKAEKIQRRAKQAEVVRHAMRKRLQQVADTMPQVPPETTRDGQDS